MKKLLAFSIISASLIPVLAFAITAGTIPTGGDLKITGAATNVKSTGDILNLIGDVVGYVYTVFFIVAVLFIIFAAFNYLTGGDAPEKIKSAHSQLIYAAIAIAVALLAVTAQVIVGNFIKGNSASSSDIQLPGSYYGPSDSPLF